MTHISPIWQIPITASICFKIPFFPIPQAQSATEDCGPFRQMQYSIVHSLRFVWNAYGYDPRNRLGYYGHRLRYCCITREVEWAPWR